MVVGLLSALNEICDPPREEVPPHGFIQIIYDVI